ncbi:hypothetical protein TNCV_4092691 [Trichonephila clavipes]|nr:hypothetical protein TNCV_4092691 [Trichonephila clavipes]
MELAQRKRKEEMEIVERKRRADFEQMMRDVEMEFKTQKKLIELEGEYHFARACLDIEVSIDRGNIGNELRSNLSCETGLNVEVEDRLKADEETKAVEEGRKMEEEGKMNEIIALEGEIRLKKERWLVKEQMRHVQKRIADQYIVAQCVGVEKEKEEISVDVIKDKDNLNPVILSKERMDFDEDESEEEKPKLPKRKRKNLNRMIVSELQHQGNLKASNSMVLIPQHWSFKLEYSQDKNGIGKLAWKHGFYQARWYCEDTTIIARKSNDKETIST